MKAHFGRRDGQIVTEKERRDGPFVCWERIVVGAEKTFATIAVDIVLFGVWLAHVL
jgi:hypothetical protein